MNTRPLNEADQEALRRFVEALPERDRTFLKERIDEATIARWCADSEVARWGLDDGGGELIGLLSIAPGTSWSSHVGELRIVVAEGHRRRGLGRLLARRGLSEALRLGLRKIVVEVVAEKEADITMFTSLGFKPEALLSDHIMAGDGTFRDLVVMSHEVQINADTAAVLGLSGELGLGADK